ncbi:ABC transporter permease subunit [Ectobacillus ponti]|uniref:ABC transporter permease subunit n=1 Tax=Ectobacillus ponti TaxID=2961894 RepID=A0AA41XD10_9BACI|nr:ABC transporter permease subunit [Ectobacillus ponti]MCP8970650.1 ABC transporter permease subunit [Ectobacillus ponti]
MNKSVIWAIAQKDMRAITTNNQIWGGMVVLPLILCVLMPGGIILAAKLAPTDTKDMKDMIQAVLQALPADMAQDMRSWSGSKQMIYVLVNYMLGSLFLLIPCLNSMMTAANSFVGEKERRTLESLLFAPITMTELFVGKVLSALLPAIVLSFISFVLFCLVVNGLTIGMFPELLAMNANWLLLVFWLSPILSLFSVLLNVLISARVQSFQAAQQMGATIVLPVIALVIGQATGMLLLSPMLLFAIGLVLLVGNVLLLKLITRYNDRNLLFEKQI